MGRAERYADDLGLALETLDEVRFVEARLDTDFIERHQLLYASKDTLDELLEELTDEIDARKVEGAGLGLGLERPEQGLDFDLRARFRSAAKAPSSSRRSTSPWIAAGSTCYRGDRW